MMVAMHFFELKGDAKNALAQALGIAFARAKTQLSLLRKDLIVRDLRPEDIGAATPIWTFDMAAANSWNSIIDDKSCPDNTYLIFNGYHDPMDTLLLSALEWTAAGQVRRKYMFQHLGSLESNTLFVTDPLIVDQNQKMTLKAFNKTGSTESNYYAQLLGLAIERAGLVLSK